MLCLNCKSMDATAQMTDVGFHHRWTDVSQSRPLNESENIFKANIMNPS